MHLVTHARILGPARPLRSPSNKTQTRARRHRLRYKSVPGTVARMTCHGESLEQIVGEFHDCRDNEAPCKVDTELSVRCKRTRELAQAAARFELLRCGLARVSSAPGRASALSHIAHTSVYLTERVEDDNGPGPVRVPPEDGALLVLL